MTAVQEPLWWEPCWEQEPKPVAGLVTVPEPPRVFGDHGGSPSRPRRIDDLLRPLDNVVVTL